MSSRGTKPESILKKFLVRKQKANPKYSLRSFARDVGVDSAFLSRVMNGKQALPAQRIEKIAEILELDAVALKDLKKSIALQNLDELGLSLADFGQPSRLPVSVLEYDNKPFTLKEMSVLSPWYNIYLMELATCEPLPNKPELIAKRLGITINEATRSIRYLVEKGYLKSDSNSLVKTDIKIRLPTKSSTELVRQFHKSVLTETVKEMTRNTDPSSFSRRLITNASVAVNPKTIPVAKEFLQRAQLEATEILRDGECTEVYNVGMLLVPISKR